MFEDESTGNENRGFVERPGVRVILSTAPEEAAVRLARRLVESGLVACVNVLPKVSSIYRWEGKIEESNESLLVIKTTVESCANAVEILRREHPYDCPEILAFDAVGGLEAYLAWVSAGSVG